MKESDLKVEAILPETKGGQHVGMYHIPIRVTHLPTGIFAQCEYERSQHKNKDIAMIMVEFGLVEMGWKDE